MTAVPKTQFASDNTAGVCPEAWSAMERSNHGSEPSYGDDTWTARASDLLQIRDRIQQQPRVGVYLDHKRCKFAITNSSCVRFCHSIFKPSSARTSPKQYNSSLCN